MTPQTGPKTSPLFSEARLLTLLALSYQLLALMRFANSPDFLPTHSDMGFYSDWGLRIAHGQLSDGQAFYGLPGYAYLLGAFYWLFGFDPFVVGLVQTLLFALVAGLLYSMARLAFADAEGNPGPRVVGWLAGLGWIFFVPAQTFSLTLMPTVWALLAYWLIVWWLLRTRARPPLAAWLILGAFMGMVSMMVATVLLLTPLVLASIYKHSSTPPSWPQRLRTSLPACALLLVGIALGAAPASLHNRLLAHEAVNLSAHSGINFWIGNHPGANGYPKMPPGLRAAQNELLKDSIKLAEAAAGKPLPRSEVSRYWTQKATAYIRAHPLEWLALIGRKFLNFWNVYQYDDVTCIKLFQDAGITWPLGLRFGWIAALAIPGMFIACRRMASSRWIAAAVLLHMLALMPVFITERYRLAAVPGLLLFAAWTLYSLHGWILQRQWLAVVSLAGSCVASAWLVSIPRTDTSLWSLDFYEAGIRALDHNSMDRAEANLAQALSYSPHSADINFAVGNLFYKRGENRLALPFYKRALDLNPRHDGALNNLGILALQDKQLDLAETFFNACLAVERDNPKTYYLLACTRLEKGDIPGATAALGAALRLKPGQAEFLQLKAKLGTPR